MAHVPTAVAPSAWLRGKATTGRRPSCPSYARPLKLDRDHQRSVGWSAVVALFAEAETVQPVARQLLGAGRNTFEGGDGSYGDAGQHGTQSIVAGGS